MSHPRRVVSRLLSLSCAVAVGAAPLTACQQIQELTGGGKKEDPPPTTPTPPADTKVAQPEVAPVLPPPTIATPEHHLPAATLDTLLALVQADTKGPYFIFRHPGLLLDYGDEAVRFFEKPLQGLKPLMGPQGAELEANFNKFKAGLTEARTKLNGAGIDLARGAVITQTGAKEDSTVVIISAAKPEAVKELLVAAKLPDAEKTVCKGLEDNYVACADSDAILGAYKKGDAAKLRASAQAGLPGVTLDDLNVLGFIPDDGGVHLAMATPPGQVVMHVALPAEDSDTKEVTAVLEPAAPGLLRFTRPGSGFVWAHIDPEGLKKANPDFASVPPPGDTFVKAWNGEVMFAGLSDPAAIQLRLGVTDPKPLASALEAAAKAVSPLIPKEIPGTKGSKIKFETETVNFGAEETKALHVALTGVPDVQVLTAIAGLSSHAWAFAAEGSVGAAIGVDEKALPRLAALPTADATLATLPTAASDDLKAGRASMIAHAPLDALQGPSLRKVVGAALKNVPEFKPELLASGLAMLSPVSSGTVWITEVQGKAVVHMAVQSIGNSVQDEGKAALAAAVAVAGGADPATAFAELVSKYPSSPLAFAYQTRAGTNGPGVLAGSAVAGMVAAGALAFVLLTPQYQNADLAKDVGVTIAPEPVEKVEKKQDDKKTDDKKTDDKKADDAKKKADDAKKAEDKKKADDAKAAEDKKKADEAKKADDAKKKADREAEAKKALEEAMKKRNEDAKKKREEAAKKKAEEGKK